MTVTDFEEAVWAVEGVRIVIRAPIGTIVGDYNYQNASVETLRVTQWLANRVTGNTGAHEISVLQGDGEEPHGRVILRTLRQSYG